MYNFTQQDLIQATNLTKILKKAKMELEGVEVLAAAEVMKWTGKLIKDIENNLAAQKAAEAVSKVSVVEMASPIQEPKPKRKTKD